MAPTRGGEGRRRRRRKRERGHAYESNVHTVVFRDTGTVEHQCEGTLAPCRRHALLLVLSLAAWEQRAGFALTGGLWDELIS